MVSEQILDFPPTLSHRLRGPKTMIWGCGFFAYSWKLRAYSGAFLLTIDNFSFFSYNWSFFAYSFSFFTYNWSFFTCSGKVHLIRALRGRKQGSWTVSKKAPTVSKKASPIIILNDFMLCFCVHMGSQENINTKTEWVLRRSPAIYLFWTHVSGLPVEVHWKFFIRVVYLCEPPWAPCSVNTFWPILARKHVHSWVSTFVVWVPFWPCGNGCNLHKTSRRFPHLSENSSNIVMLFLIQIPSSLLTHHPWSPPFLDWLITTTIGNLSAWFVNQVRRLHFTLQILDVKHEIETYMTT